MFFSRGKNKRGYIHLLQSARNELFKSVLSLKKKKKKLELVFAVLFLGSLHNVPQHSDSSKQSIHVAPGA